MDAIPAAADQPFDREFQAIAARLQDVTTEDMKQTPQQPVQAQPAPAPKPASPSADYDLMRPQQPAATATLPQMEAPPELTVPPKPKLKTSGMVAWWADAFPHLVWLSVIAGLVGQVYGWTITFGGGVVAIAVACVLGGTFEFIMVAASSRGLRDIGQNRPMWQCVGFLLAGTACAAMAFWMNLHHFTGELALVGMAAAAATAVGYLAHVFVHLCDELDNRRDMAGWETERDRVEAEIKAREARARAEHDAWQTKLRQAHFAKLEAPTRPDAEPVEPEHPADHHGEQHHRRQRRAAPLPKVGPKKQDGRKFDRETALRELGEHCLELVPSELNRRMQDKGYAPVDSSTIRRWRKKD